MYKVSLCNTKDKKQITVDPAFYNEFMDDLLKICNEWYVDVLTVSIVDGKNIVLIERDSPEMPNK